MNYFRLLVMAILSFISMYVLMYMMVDSYSNVYSNLNQLYMAGMMTIPMVLIELILMKDMYPNKKFNALISLTSLVLFGCLVFFIRKQIAIDDREFLRSMIPHHAAALLMCRETRLQDPEIKELCKNISRSQQAEIDFMKKKLAQLSR